MAAPAAAMGMSRAVMKKGRLCPAILGYVSGPEENLKR